jgi:5-methylcytosine-specific restriction endonuclease McrA
VWQHVTPGVLEEIRDKSYRQVQAIVSRFNPMTKHRDVTRAVTVRKPVANIDKGRTTSILKTNKLGEKTLRRGGKKSSNDEISTPPEPAVTKMETVKMHQISCMVDDTVMQKLNRCKELLSGKYPCGMDLNTVLLELASSWLDKNDPVQRLERRRQNKKPHKSRRADRGESSRHISQAVRDAVYKRDGGRCAYVGSNGKRCGATWDLEIHHADVPFALGGSHSISNLRLLCAAHNKLEAERIFGKDHVKKFYRKIE